MTVDPTNTGTATPATGWFTLGSLTNLATTGANIYKDVVTGSGNKTAPPPVSPTAANKTNVQTLAQQGSMPTWLKWTIGAVVGVVLLGLGFELLKKK